MRTQGCLRVVLNTKLWSGMMVERASSKTVRFTATEDDVIRVFLIMVTICSNFGFSKIKVMIGINVCIQILLNFMFKTNW